MTEPLLLRLTGQTQLRLTGPPPTVLPLLPEQTALQPVHRERRGSGRFPPGLFPESALPIKTSWAFTTNSISKIFPLPAPVSHLPDSPAMV